MKKYDVAEAEAAVAAGGHAENPKAIEAARLAAIKPRLDLIEPEAKRQIAAVMSHGAAKYGARNYFRTPLRASTYKAAMDRHLDAWWAGELTDVVIDPETGEDVGSGLSHLAHIGACINILLAVGDDAIIDDRAEPGGSVEQRTADALGLECKAEPEWRCCLTNDPEYADQRITDFCLGRSPLGLGCAQGGPVRVAAPASTEPLWLRPNR